MTQYTSDHHELPKNNILIQSGENKETEDETFKNMCSMPEFTNLFSENNCNIVSIRKDLSWKEFYNRIVNIFKNDIDQNIINQYAANNNLIELKLLHDINSNWLPNNNGTDKAAKNGHLKVLKWLKSFNILPTQWGCSDALHENHYDTLEFCLENNIKPYSATSAASRGDIKTLNLLKKYGILPDYNSIIWAAVNGHLEVFKWMAEIQSVRKFANGIVANEARVQGHNDIVDWLAQYKIYPKQV